MVGGQAVRAQTVHAVKPSGWVAPYPFSQIAFVWYLYTAYS